MDAPEDSDAVGALGREVERVADRLRSMSDVRLSQPFPVAGSRAAAALDLAQQLADAACGVEESERPDAPARRVVPDVGVFALGDQVAVTGSDLVAAAARLAPDRPVWSAGERRPLVEVLQALTEAVRELRRAL